MTALATRPEDLRQAAQSLARARVDLAEIAELVSRSAQGSEAGWQGLAALGQRAATARVHAAVVARCVPVERASAALDTFSIQAEQARAEVRAAQRDGQTAETERARLLRLLATVTEPAELESLRQRLGTVEVAIRRSADQVISIEAGLEQARRVLDQALRDSWLGMGVDDLIDLINAGKGAAPIWRGGGLVLVGARVLINTARLARPLDPFAQALVQSRMDRLLKAVMKRPLVALLTMLPARFIVPVVVISDAVPDVMDGGGYDGWQGVTVRVTAALAIPGSMAMVMPHPVAAGIGAIAVGAYYLAKGGFALYDHRLLLAQVAARAYGRRHEIIDVAKKILQPTPAFPLGPLGPMYPVLPRASEALSELPRLGDLLRQLPVLGAPIGVPQVPIRTGPRLPAIPPPPLAPISLGLLLPKIGRLF